MLIATHDLDGVLVEHLPKQGLACVLWSFRKKEKLREIIQAEKQVPHGITYVWKLRGKKKQMSYIIETDWMAVARAWTG